MTTDYTKDNTLNIYEEMMKVLEQPYAPAPNRDELISCIAGLITPEQAEAFLAFPDFSFDPADPPAEPLSMVAARLRPELAAKLPELTEDMVTKKFIVCRGRMGGEKLYMHNYLFGLLQVYIFSKEDSPLHRAGIRWYYDAITHEHFSGMMSVKPTAYVTIPHEGAVTGDDRYGKISMNIAIPDEREVIPYDMASNIIKNARRTAVKPCICRHSMHESGAKECDYPVDGFCMPLDEAADAAIATGLGEEKTKEEMLELLKKARDMGLVQEVGNANRPLSICNCCRDCCVFLNSLARGERTLSKPSRFVTVRTDTDCIKCESCIKICPMEVIKMTDQGADIQVSKCIGCGLCVTRCPVGAIKLEKRKGDKRVSRDRERLDRPYI